MGTNKKITLIFMVILLAGGLAAGAAYSLGMFDKKLTAEETIYFMENEREIKAKAAKRLQDEEASRREKERKDFVEVYWKLDKPLLANVYRSPKYIQVEIALLLDDNKKGDLVKELEKHNFGIRNQLLNVLSAQQEEVMASQYWRKDLALELKIAVNDFLEERTGFREVKDVYFGELVVQ